MRRIAPASLVFALCSACLPLAAQTIHLDAKGKPSPWGEWVEADFPFFSSVLDCRDLGEGFPKDNLTPRGLILNLGHNLWACFDTELLRLACIWEGVPGKPPITPNALAPGSYHVAGQKTKDGQEDLPKPLGKVWLANGLYPGWQVGEKPSFTDPREPAPSAEEVGRGPLKNARFLGVDLDASGPWLRYQVGDSLIRERLRAVKAAEMQIERVMEVSAVPAPLALVLEGDGGIEKQRFEAMTPEEQKAYLNARSGLQNNGSAPGVKMNVEFGSVTASFAASASPRRVKWVRFHRKPWMLSESKDSSDVASKPTHWPQAIPTPVTLSTSPDAFVIDSIPLPVPNPWKRNVRLADLAFLNDQGDAAGVTFDGDVWLISGLKGDLEKVTWKRFASGLHEPMSIVVREGEIFVFDRNGIWKLIDSDNDRECDRYEMFCNLFAQTAETREFPNSMKLGPDGVLYISKGGQEGTTRGKHNGTVIKVAADGKSFEVIGYGLRQPFIGVNPQTGMVTASDQQGHYVPSTPLHIIEKHHFYGHLPTIAEKEKYPEAIADPWTWIPHPVNPSGVTQTWLLGSKMGPVDGELIHIGYNRPELFRVLPNRQSGTALQPVQSPEGQVKNLSHLTKPQAAVVSFSRDFDFPTLNGTVNPADGQLYVTGFQVWGTVATKLSGLARVRWTGKPRVLLMEVTPTDKGVLLRFNAKLDPKLATDPASYSAERWNYKRTAEYGSPHLKPDGSAGQEFMTASSAYLSQDGMSVLVGFPGMKAGVSQMRIGWGLKSADGLKAENTAYFTPWELANFDAEKEGFGRIEVDLTPRAVTAAAMAKPTAEEGARLYQMFGCMACHSTDGSTVGKVGPSWKGLYGSEREIAKGMKGKVKADAAYLRESILNPGAKVVKGFEKFDTGMPIYAGILNDSQIDSLILYIETLK
ncbi:MAG: c-type cytochrome [Prosthecobacter sp.]|nr:c-type cytochrome [Prosthecobacter sp.]